MKEKKETIKGFMEKFNFREDGKLLVGIERECHLIDTNGKIAPIAPIVLEKLNNKKRFGYELSACQLEDRIGPVNISNVKNELKSNDEKINRIMEQFSFRRSHLEVGPNNMSLDVYPDPTGRYQKITKDMPKNILLAACQVIGTHIHIGMPNRKTALEVYNKVIKHFDKLCILGDGSNGKRLEIYKIMAPDCIPRPYSSWNNFHENAVEKEFVSDPRKCWHLIRISVHGTIEFRMFGATGNIDKIVNWAMACHNLCREEIK